MTHLGEEVGFRVVGLYSFMLSIGKLNKRLLKLLIIRGFKKQKDNEGGQIRNKKGQKHLGNDKSLNQRPCHYEGGVDDERVKLPVGKGLFDRKEKYQGKDHHGERITLSYQNKRTVSVEAILECKYEACPYIYEAEQLINNK